MMKISHEEYIAVKGVLGDLRIRLDDHVIRQVLEAAYTVRKAHKAAKRERQRKEKDKQVVESVKEAKPDELSIEDGLKRGQFLGLNSKTVAMMNPSKAHLSIMPADDEFTGVSG